MATLQARNVLPFSSSSFPSLRRTRRAGAAPAGLVTSRLSLPKPAMPNKTINMEELVRINGTSATKERTAVTPPTVDDQEDTSAAMWRSKLYAIAEAAADRAEMHAVIGEQRNNWNALLLSSINSIILAASISAGLAAMPSTGSAALAFRTSSALLYLATTIVSLAMNYLQPSQLAEEQRNASRLFKQIANEIHAGQALRSPSQSDVEGAMERVLAIDEAYPLALLGVMLEKFPRTAKPAVWWPKHQCREEQEQNQEPYQRTNTNGWSEEVGSSMAGVLDVLKRKDTNEFLRLGNKVLGINRTLAVCGPLLTGLAAVGAMFIDPSSRSWAVLLGVIGGALAAVANTMEHGGQVGMVFELYRNCAGYYRHLEEEIERNLSEGDFGRRENGELFEMKVALQLGRSLRKVRGLSSGEGKEEFAGKLF